MTVTHTNILSVEDYCRLRKTTGWYEIPEDVVRKALAKSDYVVSAIVDGTTVGMARLIIDGVQALVMDVIVHPDYQGKGIGKSLMRHIVQHVENTYDRGVLINLMTLEKNTGFYETLGFGRLSVDGVIAMRLQS